jgi:hypothetical protein
VSRVSTRETSPQDHCHRRKSLAHKGQYYRIDSYMFDPKYPLFVRGLSLFHGWLPFLLLWLVWRLGYDRRAFLAQTVLTWALLLACFFVAPAPPAPLENSNAAVNINYVHGLSYEKAQTWMHPWLWLAGLLIGLPVCLYLPTHLVLGKVFPRRKPPPRLRRVAGADDGLQEPARTPS